MNWIVLLANHLWQSTLFAGAMWMLTIALKKNSAAVRYGVWMAASVKFVVPFALLVSLGSHFGWKSAPKIAQASAAVVVEEIGQPFDAQEFASVETTVTTTHVSESRRGAPSSVPVRDWLPEMLLAVWLCGFVVNVALWLRWVGKMRALRRMGAPMELGLPIRVLSSRMKIEPCVFGVFRPVMLLPEGIEEQLTQDQLNAIVAHEWSHVQRRDNLTAALHVCVETVFWFYPVLRWVRVRMMEERERACDEAVLRQGSEPEVYAESILRVCKFYLAAQPVVAAGVSGARLKQRIETIVNHREAMRMSFTRKMGLAVVAVMAVGVPVVFGQMGAAPHGAVSAVVRPMGKMLAPAEDTISAVVEDMPASKKLEQTAHAAPVAREAAPDEGAVIDWKLLSGADSDAAKAEHARSRLSALQEKTNGKMVFEAASIRQSFPGGRTPPNFPNTKDDAYTSGPNAEYIADSNLVGYIEFAYKLRLSADQRKTILANLPEWVGKDTYAIHAKSASSASKDEMRQMVQSLLAERFKLALHFEKKEEPVFALTLVQPGKLGPKLRPHSEGPPCDASGPEADGVQAFPADCDRYMTKISPAMTFMEGSRNTTMGLLAASFNSMSMMEMYLQHQQLDHPVVDQTGLDGRYDFTLEWSPDDTITAANGRVFPPDVAPTILEALKQQLGLKLVSTKALVDMPVVNHVEKPTEN